MSTPTPDPSSRTVSAPPPSAPPSEAATLPPGSETVTLPHALTASAGTAHVPGYEVLGELGRGGMGVVYKARQLGLHRLVALKMILAGGHAGQADLDRFRVEAEAVARLQHPNIVQVYEVGEHEGKPFFSLEYCAGGNLEHKLSGTPLPAKDAARLVETLARAMHAAHLQHILHRDLKPANVLLAADGTPKITDFGLAKKMDEAGQTASGAIMGTPSYMAPEQAGGKAKDMGPAADVYALGAILYECLTGRPPFKAATAMDTILQVVADDPVPPRQLQSKTPRDLETVCLKCLEKEPKKRYLSAEALADDLRRFQAGRSVTARPVGAAERAWRWCRRNPVVATLAAAVAASLVIGTAVASYFAVQAHLEARETLAQKGRADEKAAEADKKAAEAQVSADAAREAKRTSDRRLYISDMRLAQRAWEDNDLERLRELLAAHQPAQAGGDDLRDFEWYYWQRVSHAELLTLQGHTDSLFCVAFSPDGRRVAAGTMDGAVKWWDARSGEEMPPLEKSSAPANPLAWLKQQAGLGPENQPVESVAFSPDGARLAAGCWDKTVKVWDLSSRRIVLTFRGHKDMVGCAAFSPDGKRVASGSADGAAKIWHADDGKEILSLTVDGPPATTLAWSPDGRRLATGADHKTIRLWDAATGKLEQNYWGNPNDSPSLAFSRDGARLAAAAMGGVIQIWNVADNKLLLSFKGPAGLVNGLAFSPDGKRLAAASRDQTVRVWDAATGRLLLVRKGHTGEVSKVAFSPDGGRLATASADGTVKVWEAEGDQEAHLMPNTGPFVAFSPDGARMATAGVGVRVWNTSTWEPVLTSPGHSEGITSVVFSPDGGRLATTSWDKSVKIWVAGTGRELLTLKGHAEIVWGAVFRPDGRRLASASQDGTVKVWDLDSGRELLSTPKQKGEVLDVAWSLDGSHLAGALDDGSVKVWDAATLQELFSLPGDADRATSVAFSPDSQFLAAGVGRTIRVWDLAGRKVVRSMKGHTEYVTRVLFSPNGRRLVSGSADQTVRVWDADSGQELLTLRGYTNRIGGIALTADGGCLAGGAESFDVKVWDARPREGQAEPSP